MKTKNKIYIISTLIANEELSFTVYHHSYYFVVLNYLIE